MRYAIETLARRWHVPPWALEADDADPEWILRGLSYMELEAKVKKSPRSRDSRGR